MPNSRSSRKRDAGYPYACAQGEFLAVKGGQPDSFGSPIRVFPTVFMRFQDSFDEALASR